MKYPPTIERGSPVSACQRNGSVKVDIGTGTTRTLAEGGSRSAANAADQPAGTGVAVATGSGFGTMGRTTRIAAAITTAAGRQPAASRASPSRDSPAGGIRRAANAAKAGTAASTAKASSAAAAPSASRENRSGSADSSSGRPCSQYQGSLIAGW